MAMTNDLKNAVTEALVKIANAWNIVLDPNYCVKKK